MSLPDEQKYKFVQVAADLVKAGWKIYSTAGTYALLKDHKIRATKLAKISEKAEPSATTAISKRQFGLMVCVPSFDQDSDDAYIIRRLAVDNHVPLFTNVESGRLFLRCLADRKLADLEPKAWQDYLQMNGG